MTQVDPFLQHVLGQVAAAAPNQGQFDYIKDGKHELEIVEYKATESSQNRDKKFIAVVFEVIKSSGEHRVGDKVNVAFQLTSFDLENYKTAAFGRLNAFHRELLVSFYPNPSIEDLNKVMVSGLSAAQPFRGIRIMAEAFTKPPKPKKDGTGMTKPFTDVKWVGISGQTAEGRKANVAAQIARVSQVAAAAPRPAPVPPPAPVAAPIQFEPEPVTSGGFLDALG